VTERYQISDAITLGMGVTLGGQYVPLEEIYVAKELPLYVCHKKVRALEIRSIGNYTHDANDRLTREVVFADPEFKPIWVPGELFTRYSPLPGDYYVVYEDGYASFSPRKAFLEGYSLAQDESVLMERLNDLAETARGQMVLPEWLRGFDAQDRVQRVAREAYVTINSLKQQIETIDRAKEIRANGTAIMDRIIEAMQIDHYPGSAALNELLRDCAAEIARLRADVVATRQMAGFKEVKREKADPDQA
jgi:hypothetical protein